MSLFKRSEKYWGGDTEYHGSNGLLTVSQVNHKLEIGEAFVNAAVATGIKRNKDFNGVSQEGVGYFDANIDNGIRHSCASAFLYGTLKPDNLHILTDFEVSRIAFSGSRVNGIEGYGRGSEKPSICAQEEVLLSARAYNTPKLLKLSGGGDKQRLSSLGIKVIAHLPEVGENLQDHCNNYLFYETQNCDSYYDYIMPGKIIGTTFAYLMKRQGIFSNPATQLGAFFV